MDLSKGRAWRSLEDPPERLGGRVNVFDSDTKTWSTLSAVLTHAMSDPASFAIGTKIFFVGGYETTEYNATDKVWSYDTAAGTFGWTAVADAPSSRGDSIGVTLTPNVCNVIRESCSNSAKLCRTFHIIQKMASRWKMPKNSEKLDLYFEFNYLALS